MTERNYIKIDGIVSSETEIKIKFSVSDELRKFFKTDTFTYNCPQIDCCPLSIAIIPFVTNVLPLIWLTNAILELDELDKTFYDSIDEFKSGYIKMYPKLNLQGGGIHVKCIKTNKYPTDKEIVLFSGGIDAMCTTMRHIDENISLLTLWGAVDFPYDDDIGWRIHWEKIKKNAANLNLSASFIKTNFADLLKLWHPELENLILPYKGYWHDFQHGIGIIGHAAPFSFLNHVGIVYIASTYTASDKPYTCASDPSIDNFVRFGSTKVIHDGYELSRQDKIRFIISQKKRLSAKLDIHVCLKQYSTNNCCHCEKCYRTICGLLAEGAIPEEFGFDFGAKDIPNMIHDIEKNIIVPQNNIVFWRIIQNKAKENTDNIIYPDFRSWILNYNFSRINYHPRKQYIIQLRKLKNFLKRILSLFTKV